MILMKTVHDYASGSNFESYGTQKQPMQTWPVPSTHQLPIYKVEDKFHHLDADRAYW